MAFDKIYLYRMTHIDNIPFILKNGVTHKKSVNVNPNYINIGDMSLIDVRDNRYVSVTNGDSSFKINELVLLGDYIPFYFGVRMPMLYVIQKGGNFVANATNRSKIIYVVCKLKDIIEKGLTYIFSDGHATDNFSTFYDASKIDKIEQIIDWESVNATQWSGNNIPLDLKRKKQAEFLIKEDILPELIAGFICYDETAKVYLMSLGIDQNRIKVSPKAYY